ncbi:flagellar hook-associated protein FlgK [Bacillus sp. 1P06AnD]|uniref:flagellar hook-associated protein FlgK n=1 Tax=Bacillus sp. 1P06AnD TaxID=3132208 RepID=UPI0039A05403
MRSTFMGLETAKRGMFTQQGALYVTGNNISNVNTPGYTRQRANMIQTDTYPYSGMNRPGIPGQIGTGVTTGSIERVRDSFLDTQFRQQSNSMGYYGAMSDSLTKIEQIMNEPSTSGLQNAMDKFWNSLQTLAANTENSGARDVVASSGQAVADVFNYYYNSLTRVKDDIDSQIDVRVTDINQTLKSISELNKQIAESEPHGYLPNDLYDQRDELIDKLSSMVNIKVSNVKPDNYGLALPQADGLINIELVKEDGKSYDPPINLVSASKERGNEGYNEVSISKDTATGAVNGIKVGTETIAPKNFDKSGELAALIQNFGYMDGTDVKGKYPEMLDKLNKMAFAFATEFNAIHAKGYALNEESIPTDNADGKLNFFEFDPNDPAKSLRVKDSITDDPASIRAGDGNGDAGNNKNAQALANLKTLSFDKYSTKGNAGFPTDLTGNIDSYYSGVIGKLGVESQSAAQNLKNAYTIASSVDQNRQSVSAVSLDEEMVNMIKFQHAYNASARNITIIDEMLDKIINGMGVGGR